MNLEFYKEQTYLDLDLIISLSWLVNRRKILMETVCETKKSAQPSLMLTSQTDPPLPSYSKQKQRGNLIQGIYLPKITNS